MGLECTWVAAVTMSARMSPAAEPEDPPPCGQGPQLRGVGHPGGIAHHVAEAQQLKSDILTQHEVTGRHRGGCSGGSCPLSICPHPVPSGAWRIRRDKSVQPPQELPAPGAQGQVGGQELHLLLIQGAPSDPRPPPC